jgi:hypothetical protein
MLVAPQGRKLKQGRHPLYLNIRTLDHLALRLGVRLNVLEEVAKYVPLHYNPTRANEKKDKTSFREIDAPKPLLKKIQRQIHVKLLAPMWLPDIVHGYRARHSVVTAGRPHAGRLFFWAADIRRFYPSISSKQVYRMYHRVGCSPDVAHLLTVLTTRDHHLPQGAPTSPALANLFVRLSGIARRLQGLARKHELSVTIFGDDIIVSSNNPFVGLQDHLEEVITSSGLRLNPEKTGDVVGPNKEHATLGIITNAGGHALDVPRSYRRQLRSLLYLYRRYGPPSLKARGITAKDPRKFLAGKIAFAAQVNPRHRELFRELERVD